MKINLFEEADGRFWKRPQLGGTFSNKKDGGL
jgi:hypothetical protein